VYDSFTVYLLLLGNMKSTLQPLQHWMQEIRTSAIDDIVPCASVCLSVCHAVGCAETAGRIEVLFGVETHGNPSYSVLDGVLIPHGDGVRCGLRQITLAACS